MSLSFWHVEFDGPCSINATNSRAEIDSPPPKAKIEEAQPLIICFNLSPLDSGAS